MGFISVALLQWGRNTFCPFKKAAEELTTDEPAEAEVKLNESN